MYLRSLIILFSLLASSFFIYPTLIHASTSATYTIISGVDATTGMPTTFVPADITRLSLSDDNRIQSNATTWPTGDYDESKYIEFNFNADVPLDATIESVTLSHEFRRSGALTAAKIEIWDGSNFINQPLTVGSINIDHTDTMNLSSFIDTPAKVNNLKARFLAYRGTGGSTRTSHDFVSLSVTYNVPEIVTQLSVYELIAKIKEEISDHSMRDQFKESFLKKIATLEKRLENNKKNNLRILTDMRQLISNHETKKRMSVADAAEIINLVSILEAQAEHIQLDSITFVDLKTKVQSLNIADNFKSDLLKRVERLGRKETLAENLSNLLKDIQERGENSSIDDTDAKALVDHIMQIASVI
jgi:hypothetical protein